MSVPPHPPPSTHQLVKVNQPDLVLFVGEALVGNEAVDQLSKFNQALADFSQADEPRLIDGIILTKFDTIDDKVRYCTLFVFSMGTLGYFFFVSLFFLYCVKKCTKTDASVLLCGHMTTVILFFWTKVVLL